MKKAPPRVSKKVPVWPLQASARRETHDGRHYSAGLVVGCAKELLGGGCFVLGLGIPDVQPAMHGADVTSLLAVGGPSSASRKRFARKSTGRNTTT